MSQEHLSGVAVLESVWEQIAGSQADNDFFVAFRGLGGLFLFFFF